MDWNGEPHPVLLRYEDAHQYNEVVFGPLTRMEAEADRSLKEAQTCDGIQVRWEQRARASVSDVGKSKAALRTIARFINPKQDYELRLVPGDELRLRRGTWQCAGHVVRLDADEVHLELHPTCDAQ